jgi:hypothetical protein
MHFANRQMLALRAICVLAHNLVPQGHCDSQNMDLRRKILASSILQVKFILDLQTFKPVANGTVKGVLGVG